MIITLDLDGVRALRNYVQSAEAEMTGLTLNVVTDTVYPQITGFGVGDGIPAEVTA